MIFDGLELSQCNIIAGDADPGGQSVYRFGSTAPRPVKGQASLLPFFPLTSPK
jgi:hypothetical protein